MLIRPRTWIGSRSRRREAPLREKRTISDGCRELLAVLLVKEPRSLHGDCATASRARRGVLCSGERTALRDQLRDRGENHRSAITDIHRQLGGEVRTRAVADHGSRVIARRGFERMSCETRV